MAELMTAQQVPGYDRPLLDRLIPVTLYVQTVRRDVQLIRDTVSFDNTTNPVTATLLLDPIKENHRVVSKGGLAAEECERFKRGENKTLYIPLVLRLCPTKENLLWIVENDPETELFFQANGFVLVSPTFDLVKVELGILMQQAADRAHGLSSANRRAIKAYVDTEVMGNNRWSPDSINAPAAVALCKALVDKAQEIVNMQSDQGKVWRNRSTVEHIRKGAMTVAASYNRAVLQELATPDLGRE